MRASELELGRVLAVFNEDFLLYSQLVLERLVGTVETVVIVILEMRTRPHIKLCGSSLLSLYVIH